MTALRQIASHSALVSRPGPLGLAALTRKAMAGENLAAVAQSLLARLDRNPRDAAAFLDLSTIEQLLGAGANRIALQEHALRLQRLFSRPAARADAPVLLVLMAPGDFMANTPIEFLLDGADLRVDMLFIDAAMDLPAVAPPHDVAFVAVAESDANRPLLQALGGVADRWPRPLLNAPERVARLTRDGAWRLLHDVAGVIYPRNRRMARAQISRAEEFPFIIRPVDSHAGAGLEKIEGAAGLDSYLARHDAAEFYTAPFIDYRGADGLFRKIRIAIVDGAPYPVHLAISPRWMIHYLNADMTENAAHRAEEARFMQDFAAFAQRHAAGLREIHTKAALDYFLIDCAESRDGRLLIFEVGSAMIAHDLDCPKTFPYKSAPMRRLFDAVQRMIFARARIAAAGGASLRQV